MTARHPLPGLEWWMCVCVCVCVGVSVWACVCAHVSAASEVPSSPGLDHQRMPTCVARGSSVHRSTSCNFRGGGPPRKRARKVCAQLHTQTHTHRHTHTHTHTQTHTHRHTHTDTHPYPETGDECMRAPCKERVPERQWYGWMSESATGCVVPMHVLLWGCARQYDEAGGLEHGSCSHMCSFALVWFAGPHKEEQDDRESDECTTERASLGVSTRRFVQLRCV